MMAMRAVKSTIKTSSLDVVVHRSRHLQRGVASSVKTEGYVSQYAAMGRKFLTLILLFAARRAKDGSCGLELKFGHNFAPPII